ncbi:MAG TPA: TonB-dependent receptor [Steroidobacteraceae bacterium]|nr:TonB-dependent receptor [Steroidobacteraceae bacterium]
MVLVLALAPLLAAIHASAGKADGGHLQPVTVTATGVSDVTAASAGDVSMQRIASEPLLRPAAILENVPGLIVTQHSGEGKANQYFLRAFNLDHGTDIAIDVDGVPVNLPSHAHGQGYADLNFLIPDLIADLRYEKGPYHADEGDFATAAAVRIGLINTAAPAVTLGYGEDGYRRVLIIGSTAVNGGSLLAAGEAYHNDGPFDVPDDYNRLNGVLRYRYGDTRNYLTLTAMAYSGRWNSTDQVPQRAIDEGLIDRFGSLNSTDGGVSSRSSLSFHWVDRGERAQSQLAAYVFRYKLDLWSTFTYYLKDPTLGDQMLQRDDRVVYGLNGSTTWYGALAGAQMTNVIGATVRVDDVRDVGIFPTFRRQVLGTMQDAGIVESSAAIYAENEIQWRGWLRSIVGIREDQFDFDVADKMRNSDGSCNIASDPLGCDSGSKRASIFSPKAGFVLGPWGATTFFLNLGDGYHSNDARGVTRSGQNPDQPPVTPLTRATSAELGVKSEPVSHLQTRLDVFELRLRSELVFDGDAGITTPSGATRRTGVEIGNEYQLDDWFSANLDAALTRGRFDHNSLPDDLGCGAAVPTHSCPQVIAIVGRYIPNSPTSVITAGAEVHPASGWFGAIQARHFGESPLVEDNSARSPAYTTVDIEIGYHSPQRWRAALDVFNVANVKWNDIEYYYVSRLRNEPSPTAGYVIHPGVPRILRFKLEYLF